MDKWVNKIYRMSQNQLKALRVLVDSESILIEAVESAKLLGLTGNARSFATLRMTM